MPSTMPRSRIPPVKLGDMEAAGRRRYIYEDVEALISPGFLSHQVCLGDVSLSLRSLTPGDLFLLRHRVSPRTNEREWREWIVSTCIWIVDGHMFLGDSNIGPRLKETLSYLPGNALGVLFSTFTALSNRMNEALWRVEAFSYESYSRSLWRFCDRKSPMRDEFTGVPGTSRLGMNHVQQVWVAYNTIEDERHDWLRHWQLAKFTASVHNSKGIKRLQSRDRAEQKSEEERRQRVIWDVLQRAGGDTCGGEGPVLYRSVTVDELADEMRRWVDGEKDWHDLVVDEYKARIRRRFEEEKARRARMLAEAQALRETDGLGVPEQRDLVGYTREQLEQIRGGLVSGKPGARRMVSDDHVRADLFHRYIEPEIKAGAIRSDGKAVSVRSLEGDLEDRKVRWSSNGKPSDGGSS